MRVRAYADAPTDACHVRTKLCNIFIAKQLQSTSQACLDEVLTLEKLELSHGNRVLRLLLTTITPKHETIVGVDIARPEDRPGAPSLYIFFYGCY